MFNGLVSVSEHRVKQNVDSSSSEYTFVQLADPQLGLLERYIEHREPPYKWDRELALFNRAITAINGIAKKPKFVIICGDLVDAEPGTADRLKQIADLKSSIEKLVPGIPVFVIPGNHDIGNSPSISDIEDYVSHWGDDRFVFWCGKSKYIAINSQPYWDGSNCRLEVEAQDCWLESEISAAENENADHVVIFQVSYGFVTYLLTCYIIVFDIA